MSQIRKRKSAEALAERMADSFVTAERARLARFNTVGQVRNGLRSDIDRARNEYNHSVQEVRRKEKAFDAALDLRIERALLEARDAPAISPIAPKVIAAPEESFDVAGDGYREASRAERPMRPPSDIPATETPVWRNRVLTIAVWTVVVARFATAIRTHGPTGHGLFVGLLGTLAILPIVIGAILLLMPER